MFLSNGLRFIPTPAPSSYSAAVAEYMQDDTRGWKRFSKTIASRILFQRSPDDSTGLSSKFSVRRSSNSIPFLEQRHADQFPMEISALNTYREDTSHRLQQAVEHPHHQLLTRHQAPNHSAHDRAFLRRLMDDASVTIKPADKNLGLALVDSTWYDAEIERMLSDRITYTPLELVHRRNGESWTEPALHSHLARELLLLANTHRNTIAEWMPAMTDKIDTFMKQSVKTNDCKLPALYLLIKCHKPKLSGRPIVPSTHWFTSPASVLLDHCLQGIVASANIPWLVRDTKSFVRELEHISIPLWARDDGILLTADIGSLYTNIDTQLGVSLVNDFLVEQGIDTHRIRMLLDLLKFVMNNSYLTVKGKVYLQIDGTAMGTSCAPIYANIVVYMLERKLVLELTHRGALHIYRRFLDDVFAFVSRQDAQTLMLGMNNLHPKLKFEFVSNSAEAAFLDLHITKGKRFTASGVFDLSVHQKKMNLYLYIPFDSFHTDAMKRSFIQTELMRYIRNSSDREAYLALKQLFFWRLRARGYPIEFLRAIFDSVFYGDRAYFLATASEAESMHELRQIPALSACLLKRRARTKQQRQATPACFSPPVFIIPFSPLSRVVPTRRILLLRWNQLNAALQATLPPPIMAYQSLPNLTRILVFQRAKWLASRSANKGTTTWQEAKSISSFREFIGAQRTLLSFFSPRALT